MDGPQSRSQSGSLSRGNLCVGSDDKLEVELHKLYVNYKQELQKQVDAGLEKMPTSNTDDLKAFLQEFRKAVGGLQEQAQAVLAEYVRDRAGVLKFMEKLLGQMESGGFQKEDALHTLFFPLRTTSDDVDLDDHNLWIIEERLAYHKFLASDLELSKHDGPIGVNSKDRPDVLIFNGPVAFSPDRFPVTSVVVLEFKRPERDDYDDKKKSPLRQVLQYVEQIREGRARGRDGSTIEVPRNIPFYCYVIASMTPRLKEEAKYSNFFETPDGMGFFSFNTPLQAYLEILSYKKLLEDAKKRNRIFFDKLDLKTGSHSSTFGSRADQRVANHATAGTTSVLSAPRVTLPLTTRLVGLAAGDVNGDSRLDLTKIDPVAGSVLVLLSTRSYLPRPLVTWIAASIRPGAARPPPATACRRTATTDT